MLFCKVILWELMLPLSCVGYVKCQCKQRKDFECDYMALFLELLDFFPVRREYRRETLLIGLIREFTHVECLFEITLMLLCHVKSASLPK
jgi:hypothetical protein